VGAQTGAEPTPYLSAGLSETGRRESNEDAAAFAVFPSACSLRAFAVLCDGMGGHNAGEIASRLAIEVLTEEVKAFAARPRVERPAEPSAVEVEVHGWIARVNREIYQRGKSSAEHRGMGTTVALAMVLSDDRLVVANVGDSKVFLVSGLAVRQLSVDHTALAEQRRALGSDSVAPEDDASNPFAHALTRSLGQEKKVTADVRSDVTLRAGDVVILTTDGVTDVLETERFLTALETAKSLKETAEEVVRLALEAGSKDNISVALVSHGSPARLGAGVVAESPAELPPPMPDDDVLLAGAASIPPGMKRGRTRGPRYLLLGATAIAILAVGVAAGLFLRRPSAPGPAAPRVPAPVASPAAPPPVVAQPTPTPLPAAPPTPVPVPPETNVARSVRPGPKARATAVPTVPEEPAFRTPEVLSGLKPLEYPPTPTDTPTATATPTATPTPHPTAIPTGSPGPDAPVSPTPRVRA
jgi:serine/threonine protein phosphatase PrpC